MWLLEGRDDHSSIAALPYASTIFMRGFPLRAVFTAQAGQRATCDKIRGVSLGGCCNPPRICLSRRDGAGTSMVTTSALKPASFTRFSISLRMASSRGGYIWNHPILPRYGATSSGVAVATVDIVYGILADAAKLESILSAPGQIRPDMPTGAIPKGVEYICPKKEVSSFGFISPRNPRGTNRIASSPWRLRWSVLSSPVALSRYSHAKCGIRLRARSRRSDIAGYFEVKFIP